MSQPKEWVKRRYGALARQSQRSCCDQPTACCQDGQAPAEALGYDSDDIAAAPDSAITLGCGNPLALASIFPGQTVLDLGSGAGFDAFLAARRVGPAGRVIGVDITPEMVEAARANARNAGYRNVEFHLADIERLPLADESVDLVISNCVLCLVPDKAKAFREVQRVLKPGGAIAISDIVLDGPLPAALQNDEGAYCSCVSGAVPRAEYVAQLAAAGLADIHLVSEADASALLAGECCAGGVSASDLAGVVTSIHLTARKPNGSSPNPSEGASR